MRRLDKVLKALLKSLARAAHSGCSSRETEMARAAISVPPLEKPNCSAVGVKVGPAASAVPLAAAAAAASVTYF